MSFSKFTGNCPRVVSKDAKYSVRWDKGKQVVSLIYRIGQRERVFLATTEHEPLVRMVNAVKEDLQFQTGGVFYINEWRQVIVPVTDEVRREVEYYYAGEYHGNLEFDFDGKRLSGLPVSVDGQALQPGQEWEGPHAGIPYKLRAGGRDIAYERRTAPNRLLEVRLSDHVGTQEAAHMARKIREQRDERGGRFYVNEHRVIFTPVSEQDSLHYIYVGQLEDSDPWFPKPVVESISE